jgi:hypothetical protein
MGEAIGKVIPTAIVAAIAVWFCWPYLDGPEFREVGAKTDSRQALHGLLKPVVAPEPSRDPFRAAEIPQTPGKPKGNPAAKSSGDSPSTPKNAGPTSAAEVLKGFTLSGTWIAGTRRAALINGRLWEQGQRLELSKDAAEPWVLAEVSPRSVVIASGAKRYELKYPGPEDKPARPAPAAAPLHDKRSVSAVASQPARPSPAPRSGSVQANLPKPGKPRHARD